jgi:ligand-binding sensor domain-containing protein/HPt (histidine-containing phosphotransfer) domain-containing protein/PAS domain-containing protein
MEAVMEIRWLMSIKRLLQINLVRNSFLLIISLFPAINAYGQQRPLQFKHLTADDGLSSSTVQCALQDYKGYMWFGTNAGLNRYDGTYIIVYENSPSDPGSLPSNYSKSLLEDHNQNLLVGSAAGLSRYDRDHDCFVNFITEKSSALYDLKFLINQLIEDSLGNLWLATDKGLVYFDRGNNTIKRYVNDMNNPASISFDFIECVFIDSRNRLWVGTAKGLNLFMPESENFKLLTRCKTESDENITDISFISIVEDRDGAIWFGSVIGLFRLDNNSNDDMLGLTHYKNNPRDPHSISKSRIKALLIDDEDRLLVGAENEGLNIFDKAHNNFIHYRIDELNPTSLNNESINNFAQDRNRNLWICTYKGGANLLIKNSDFIIHYKNIPGMSQSLSYNIVSSFFEDRYNRIWVGTDGGGFNLFNDTTNRFTRFYCTNPSLNRNSILCMAERSENQIWMGTWEGGLLCYNSTTNSFTSFTRQNSGITDNCIYSIAKDTCGNLWLGSFKGGLIYYQVKENKFTGFSIGNSQIADVRITVVRMGAQGQLYLGSNKAFQIYYPVENRFVTFTKGDDDTTGISNNNIYDILVQDDTSVWVGTESGLNRFNPITGKFNHFFKSDGLPDNSIKGLVFDTCGMLWVTTNCGICRYDPRKASFKNFSPSDGTQGNEFFETSIFLTKQGTILAGGVKGFNLIHPDRFLENNTPPPVIINDFHLFNEKVTIGIKGSPLKKQISESRSITLSYKQSVMTFYFSVLDFTNPDKNRYAYWMENFDRSWTYCGNRKDATYTNLDPGRYCFHVKGSNNDGVWNEIGTSVELVITPPWWQTKAARAGFVLLIILALLWVYFYFRSRQEQKHLRAIVATQKKIEDIMRSIDEAIFTLNEDMSINKEHSKTAEKIFGIAEFETQNLASLFRLDEKTALSFAKWLKLAFRQPCTAAGWEKAMRFNPLQELVLERERGIYLSINYQPIYENNVLSRVMVIVNDITLQKEAEAHLSRLNIEKELLKERVFAIVNNDYDSVATILGLGTGIINSFETLNFNAREEYIPHLQELGRDIHTLKGNSGSMRFASLSICCNDLENALEAYTWERNRLNSKGRERIDTALSALKVEIEAITKLRNELYRGKEDKLSIEKSDFTRFNEELKKGAFQSIDEISYHFLMLTSLKFSEFCLEFSTMVTDYGERFQKNIAPLKIETPEVRLDRAICKALKGPVTHLIRNAIDHGIEDNATREKSNKGPGHISMAARENTDTIEVEITDDGKGIDPVQVAASAIKKGFITPELAQGLTDTEKQNLIFRHGFSTRDEATAISGRGVGMDVVKTDIEKAGGGVKLISRVGEGTRITLWAPRMLQ